MPVLPTAFRLAARLRRARAFHPSGSLLHATWRPAEGADVPAGSPLLHGQRPALVRISHGAGLPPGAPDVVGIAVKVLDAHGPGRDQDLLLSSSGRGRISRHLLRPTCELTTAGYSTLLPYEVAGAPRGPIVARTLAGAPAVRYAQVLRDGAARFPGIELRVGGFDGPLLATVTAEAVADVELAAAARFDPWHTGPELRPVGWLNRLRRPTYAASREGRGAPADGRLAVPSGRR